MASSKENWDKIKRSPVFAGRIDEDAYLGRGRFGEVFSYADSTGKVFALKRINLFKELDKCDTPPTDVEDIELLRSLNHENIVRLFRVERGQRQIYLYLELMDGGNLQLLIDCTRKKGQFLAQPTVKSYTAQLLLGLLHLHERKIVHRDVKPANVLLDASKTVAKLTDFSLSKLISTTAADPTRTAKGTYHYMAPEVVRCESFSVKSDIWSLGATIVEMLTGNPPFANIKTDATLVLEISQLGKSKQKPDYDRSRADDLSVEIKELLDRIFQPYPAARPSASALLALDYFKPEDREVQGNSDLESEYALSLNSKGRVLIINNVLYENLPRPGSELDATRIIETLEPLGFTAVTKVDLKAADILKSIRTFAADAENSRYSSFIIFILAHGSAYGVYGIDGELLRFDIIINSLSSTRAPLLSCKPKVLIVQACRGTDRDVPHTCNVAEAKTSADCSVIYSEDSGTPTDQQVVNLKGAFASDSEPDSKIKSPAECGDCIGDDMDEDTAVLDFASSKSDILVAYSTCSGYVSYRNAKCGSVFIQSFCNAVTMYWRKMSLLDIMSIVSGQVGSTVFTSTRERRTQIPQVKSTLRLRFFLSHAEERQPSGKSLSSLASEAGATVTMKAQTPPTTPSSANARRPELLPGTSNAAPIKPSLRLSVKKTVTVTSKERTSTPTSPTPTSVTLLQTSPSSPPTVQAAAFPTAKHVLLIAGGCNNTKTFAYDPASNSWQTAAQAQLSCQRYGTAGTLWNGKMVVAGGFNNGANTCLNSAEQYDPKSNCWSALALPSMQQPRQNLALACFENSLFAIGGWDGTKNLDSVERYNLDAKQWQRVASLNVKRSGLCCAVIGVGILVVGGYDGLKRLNSCEMLEGATKKWRLAGSLVTARSSAAAATISDKVYVFGGYNGKALDSIEEYDGAVKKWTLLQVRLSKSREELAAATVNGVIYVCGGQSPAGYDVDSFDASEMRITPVSPLPEAMQSAAAVSLPVSNKILELFQVAHQ